MVQETGEAVCFGIFWLKEPKRVHESRSRSVDNDTGSTPDVSSTNTACTTQKHAEEANDQ